MGRTKATLIHQRTKNVSAAVFGLLGHFEPESSIRYLCIEVDHFVEISKQFVI